jgi:hypothetical protein
MRCCYKTVVLKRKDFNSPNVPYEDLISQQLSYKKMKVTENLNFFIFCQLSSDVQTFQDPLVHCSTCFFSNYEQFVTMKETRKKFHCFTVT